MTEQDEAEKESGDRREPRGARTGPEQSEAAQTKAEGALRVAVRKWRSVFDSISDAVCIIDRDGRIQECNRGMAALLGRPPEEIVGGVCWELMHGTPGPVEDCPYVRTMKSHRRESSVFPMNDRWFTIIAEPIIDEAEGFVGIVHIATDITERKQAEDALWEREEQYRLFFHHAPIGIFNYDRELRITECNDTFIRILRTSRENLIGFDMNTLQDRSVSSAIRKPLDGEGGLYEGPYRTTISGADLRILMRTAPLFDRQGRVAGGVGILEDITEREKAADELSERVRQTALGAEIGAALTQGKDLRTLLQLCAESIVKQLDAAFARIWTLNEQDDVLELQASAGMYTHLDGPHGRVPVGSFKIGMIARERRPHLTNEVIGDPLIGDPEWAKREGMVAFAGHPLIVADKLVGVMAMFSKKPLKETTLSILASVADEIALGIDHKRSEEALKKSESMYRTLAEGAHDIIFVINRSDRIEYVNGFGAGLFGHKPEELIGGSRDALFPGGISDTQRMQLRDVFETGLPYYAENRVPSPTGELWLSTLLVPLRNDGGDVTAVTGIARDITERKETEELLKKSEEQYRLLFRSNPNPMWVFDMETLAFLAVNDAAVQHYGFSYEEFLGMTIKDVHFPEDHGALNAVSRTRRSGLSKPGIWQHKKKDGAPIDVDITTSEILFNGRKARLVLAYDVTERLKAEDSLYESEQKLRAITDAASDAIILIDDEETIVYWNSAASRMLGYGPEEIAGQSVMVVIPERYRETHARAFKGFVETGRGAMLGKTYEVHALKKDGTEIPIELSLSGIRLKEKWHAAGIIRDISERKKLEAQLLHSQKMEAVGQLAGGVAHDFNNILTAIIGYGHILHMKMKEDDPLRVNVEHMLESADRAAHLTHSLLAFSRKQIINPRPVDLNEIIRRVDKFLRRIIGEDIELRTAFRQETVTVNADSGQIEQVLVNLATNARDAMPRGGSFTVETGVLNLDASYIRAHGFGEPGRYAMMSMTDSGVGMDEATRKRIFEPFFTTKEVGKGTGLGLAILYGIVKQHHGYINVYSEPGRGTTFKIYLPLLSDAGDASAPVASLPEARIPRGKETVLIAEDDETLRRLTRTVLEEFGYSVIEAEDGAVAVARFRENKDSIKLVMLDMIMPKMSGRETYEELKKIRPDIKAFFVSGYTADKIYTEGLLEKGVELVLKPLSPRELLKKVREMLDGNAGG